MAGGSILGGIYSGSLLKMLLQLLSVWQVHVALRGSQVPTLGFGSHVTIFSLPSLSSLSFTNAFLSRCNPCAIKLNFQTCTNQ